MDQSINAFSVGSESEYQIKDTILSGSSKNHQLDKITTAHPLEEVLKKHDQKKQEVEERILRSLQGVYAPARLHLEKQALRGIGHLPCLHRHNALLDALTGRDTTLDFEDVLNAPQDSEVMGQPHVMIERNLGVL